MLRRALLVSLSLAVAVLTAFACGGRPVVQPPPADLGVVAGRVLKGPTEGATVTVYRLDGLARAAVAGTATTDADGAFRIGVGTATGPFLVAATGGHFTDEATGVTVQLNTAELTALVPTFDVETKLELRITPVSHLAAGLALRWAATEGKTLAAADAEAWQHLNAHFGSLDWRTVTPTDVTAATDATLDQPTTAGLLLASLSMQARLASEMDALTPGGRVNSLTLAEALYDDATADGFLDGVGAAGPLVLPADGAVVDAGPSATRMDGQTARTALAQAIAKFLASDRHVTRVTLADAQQLINAIATNADERLFRGAGGPADVEAPVVTFVRPTDGAGVHGTVDVDVTAVDNTAMQSFAFTAPASLTATAATTSSDGKASTLHASLDVSSLVDGPLALTVRAVDAAGNETAKTLTVVVSNRGPTITVTAPSDGATVTGLLAITATATPEAPGSAIAKLELRQAPAGVGADTLPAAADFGATWNTLQAPEGLVTLTFHAEDTLGGISDTTVTVTVDNVPFGTVTTTATLGAPVGGLSVKLLAIDDATGLPVLGRMGGAVLGETPAGVTTDALTGAVSFALTQENYEGPVQLVAAGTAASYLDPSSSPDAGTTIALPASFTVTSYVKHYKTGDALNVPLTGWTTLADDATLAVAQGKNAGAPDAGTLTAALAVVEPLFPAHLSGSSTWALRTTAPVSLTTGPQSLRDVVFAALPDVGLNQEARDLALAVGLTPGTGYALPKLLTSLRQDVSDGLFDGKAGNLQLATGGTAPYAFDANSTRFRLAIGMDAFIRGPANATGLTRQDLQTQSVFDTISMDTSILYPANQAPIPFDNLPPSVSWNVTFTNNSTTLSPVGPSRLVAGTVHLEATAADATAVASLSVTANSTALTPATGSGPARFLADFAANGFPEGPLTLTATACDTLANCAPTTFVLETDRTPPQIQALKPTPGLFPSAAFELEATATDAHGIFSAGCDSPAGVADQDAAAERFYAPASAWTLAWPDGPANVTFRACDVVRNCGLAQLTVTVDKTPPALAWVQQPPTNTNNNLVTFSVSASDVGAGVKRVLAGVDYQNPVVGVRSPTDANLWTFSGFDLGALQGPRNLHVWAEDLAMPANSGQGGPAANDLLATVLLDKAAPQLLPASYKTFKDEDAITLVTDGAGRPVVPAQYDFGSAPARTIDLSQASITIKKASTLTSWAANRPTLTWRIPFTAGTDAPITGVTWSAVRNSCRPDTGTCGNSSGGSGSLTLDTAVPSPQANSVYYSLELLWPERGTYAVTFTATDAAGNSFSLTRSIVWDVVGPPLVVIPDIAWEASGDPQALQTLRLTGSGTTAYSRMFGLGIGGYTANVVRVKRYLVYNAAPVEVAVTFASAGASSRATSESWTNLLGNLFGAEGAGSYTVDGQSFDRDYMGTFTGTSYWCSNLSRLAEPYPCPNTTSNLPYARHVRGQLQQYECFGNVRTESGTYGPVRLNNTSDALAGHTNTGVGTLYVTPASAPGSGNETTQAGSVQFDPTTGGARVPAASSNAPGITAVYVGVPVQSHSTPLSTAALPHLASSGAYQYYFADMVDVSAANLPIPTGPACDSGSTFRYATWWWYRRLAAATTTVNASWTLKSGGNFFTGGLTGTETYAGTTPRVLQSLGSSATVNH